MIAYNMRYRGAMEYDKFTLNHLQYHNEVNDMIHEEFQNQLNQDSFLKRVEEINKVYEKYTGLEGYSQQLFELSISMRRG